MRKQKECGCSTTLYKYVKLLNIYPGVWLELPQCEFTKSTVFKVEEHQWDWFTEKMLCPICEEKLVEVGDFAGNTDSLWCMDGCGADYSTTDLHVLESGMTIRSLCQKHSICTTKY